MNNLNNITDEDVLHGINKSEGLRNKAINSYGAKSWKYEQYLENSFKRTNVIQGRPNGWLIMDTYNNPYFPLDIFQYDTMKFNTSKIQLEFHKKYGGSVRDLFLPWHYTVEMVDEKPFVIQTRPLMYKTVIPGFERHISVMIIGDSSKDIYSGKFYKMMAHNIINPYKVLPGVKMSNSKETFEFWTKDRFNRDNLLKELF